MDFARILRKILRLFAGNLHFFCGFFAGKVHFAGNLREFCG